MLLVNIIDVNNCLTTCFVLVGLWSSHDFQSDTE